MRVVNKFLCKVTNSLNFIEFVELIDEISFFSLSPTTFRRCIEFYITRAIANFQILKLHFSRFLFFSFFFSLSYSILYNTYNSSRARYFPIQRDKSDNGVRNVFARTDILDRTKGIRLEMGKRDPKGGG